METSDSEHFESADEDIYSDEDVSKRAIEKKKNSEQAVDIQRKLNILSISEKVNEDKSKSNEGTESKTDIKICDIQDINYSTINSFNKEKYNEVHSKITESKIEKTDREKITHLFEKNSLIVNDNLRKNTKNINCLPEDNINEIKKLNSSVNLDQKAIAKESIKSTGSKIKLGNVGAKSNEDVHSLSKEFEHNENMWNDEDGWGLDEKNIEEKEENLWGDDEINWGQDNLKEKRDLVEEKKVHAHGDWETFKDEEVQKATKSNESNDTADNTWGGWGNWGGVSSILTTATQSVSTLTNQVSQGISTVLETSMGVPEPEELARLNCEENTQGHETQDKQGEVPQNMNSIGFGFSNFGNLVSGVSNFTKLVESTGTKVISGGLDTLETIGKKTMEVLQDGDPGLKKKRAFLKLDQEKPVLSHILREAKEKSEIENKLLQAKHFAKKMNYETIFDDHQGLVHLEALEMLSKQCDIKIQTLNESFTDEALTELQETLDQVKELCELPDEDDDEQISFEEIKERLKSAVADINITITYDKLISIWEETESWLNNLKLNICNEQELHQQAIETLAQMTAIAVEQFHKAGELLLIKEHRSTADESDSLVQLTTTTTSLIGIVAAKFSEKLNGKVSEGANKEDVNALITNVFFEAANSISYIQDAFQLLIPVLQVGAI